MQLLISDANILIDMEEGGLVTLFFKLPYEFCVPDVLYYEELEDQHSHLCELGLSLRELLRNLFLRWLLSREGM